MTTSPSSLLPATVMMPICGEYPEFPEYSDSGSRKQRHIALGTLEGIQVNKIGV